jgi:plasmid stabilization system protein ParE
MKVYRVKLLLEAHEDLGELAYAIAHSYGMPQTAEKYVRELRAKIKSLEQNPERYAARNYRFLQQYGVNVSLLSGAEVRRVDYKKMAILYTIHGSTVYIHRVVAASMITG